ncbi:MAG: ParB/RepB/Spo0J family partition protein [Phycisphaerae bacterium]|nr:ParB/RepB/Spo0J family partition protein [Phycisphaerae bacterium]
MSHESDRPNDPGKRHPPRRLGRGLESLLSKPVEINLPRPQPSPVQRPGAGVPVPEVPRGTTPAVEAPATEDVTPREGLVLIRVGDIRPNARQPRQDFPEAAIAKLGESIRSAGLMQPIVLRPDRAGGFELIAGERRWRAAKLIGLERIPAIVRDVEDQVAAEWALIENIQREDLNPMERAFALRRLADEFGLTHHELADRVGLERATVTNLLRLAELDEFTADAVRKGRLTQGHAKALLSLGSNEQRQSMAASAMAGEWSVRETERRVQHAIQRASLLPGAAIKAGAAGATPVLSPHPSPHLADLERRLGEHLGSRVVIQLGRKKGTGRVVVEFFTLDQFDGLLDKLGFPTES